MSHPDVDELVRLHAYFRWRKRVEEQRPGDAVADWYDAERELGVDGPNVMNVMARLGFLSYDRGREVALSIRKPLFFLEVCGYTS